MWPLEAESIARSSNRSTVHRRRFDFFLRCAAMSVPRAVQTSWFRLMRLGATPPMRPRWLLSGPTVFGTRSVLARLANDVSFSLSLGSPATIASRKVSTAARTHSACELPGAFACCISAYVRASCLPTEYKPFAFPGQSCLRLYRASDRRIVFGLSVEVRNESNIVLAQELAAADVVWSTVHRATLVHDCLLVGLLSLDQSLLLVQHHGHVIPNAALVAEHLDVARLSRQKRRL